MRVGVRFLLLVALAVAIVGMGRAVAPPASSSGGAAAAQGDMVAFVAARTRTRPPAPAEELERKPRSLKPKKDADGWYQLPQGDGDDGMAAGNDDAAMRAREMVIEDPEVEAEEEAAGGGKCLTGKDREHTETSVEIEYGMPKHVKKPKKACKPRKRAPPRHAKEEPWALGADRDEDDEVDAWKRRQVPTYPLPAYPSPKPKCTLHWPSPTPEATHAPVRAAPKKKGGGGGGHGGGGGGGCSSSPWSIQQFIELVQKVEWQYPAWNGEQVVAALRRLGDADHTEFRQLLRSYPGQGIFKGDYVEEEDIPRLRAMVRHRVTGPGSETHGTLRTPVDGCCPVAIQRVLLGISAGFRRDQAMENIFYPTLPEESNLRFDNLYAVTLAGDFGRSGHQMYHKAEKALTDMDGKASWVTCPVLKGGTDGFLIGKFLGKFAAAQSVGLYRIQISELLRMYYLSNDGPRADSRSDMPINARNRWDIMKCQDWEKIRQHAGYQVMTYASARAPGPDIKFNINPLTLPDVANVSHAVATQGKFWVARQTRIPNWRDTVRRMGGKLPLEEGSLLSYKSCAFGTPPYPYGTRFSFTPPAPPPRPRGAPPPERPPPPPPAEWRWQCGPNENWKRKGDVAWLGIDVTDWYAERVQRLPCDAVAVLNKLNEQS